MVDRYHYTESCVNSKMDARVVTVAVLCSSTRQTKNRTDESRMSEPGHTMILAIVSY